MENSEIIRQSIITCLSKGSMSAAGIQNFVHHELNLNMMQSQNKYEVSRQIQKMSDEGLIRFGKNFYLELAS